MLPTTSLTHTFMAIDALMPSTLPLLRHIVRGPPPLLYPEYSKSLGVQTFLQRSPLSTDSYKPNKNSTSLIQKLSCAGMN